MINLNEECDLELDFNAEVHWIHPPKNRAESVLREMTNNRIRKFVKDFEEKVEQILKDQYGPNGRHHQHQRHRIRREIS